MDRGLPVAEDLNLNVTRARDETLEVQASVAESRERLGARLRDLGIELRGGPGDADAAAAAASRSLDHQRIADGFSRPTSPARVLDPPGGARHRWHARARCHLTRRSLVAHGLDRLGSRSDKYEPGALHHRGEAGVLRQEAVAGMDGVGAARDRRGDDGLLVQVGSCRMRRPDFRDFVRHPGGQHLPVGGADRLDGADTERLRGAYDADGDFPTIGDEQRPDRHWAVRRRGRRAVGRPSPDPRFPHGTRAAARPSPRPPA